VAVPVVFRDFSKLYTFAMSYIWAFFATNHLSYLVAYISIVVPKRFVILCFNFFIFKFIRFLFYNLFFIKFTFMTSLLPFIL
jgi:hypothetical protein